MKEVTVTSTQRHTLKPIELDYPMQFAWDLKKGVNSNVGVWFTPSKKIGKVWIGNLHQILVGEISTGMYTQLMITMFNNKTHILTDGDDYFTTGKRGQQSVLWRIVNWPEVKQKLDKEFAFINRYS